MNNFIYFGIVFLVVFLVDYFVILLPRLKQLSDPKKMVKTKRKTDVIEISYISGKFKIEKNKLFKKSIVLSIALINSFIISLVSTVIAIIPFKFVIQLMVGFVLLIGLIYALYELLGRILIKKGY